MSILASYLSISLKTPARETAAAILATPGPLVLSFTGYDDDPRELWDVPEVRRYFVEVAEFEDCGDVSDCMWDKLAPDSYVLAGLLLGYWKVVKVGGRTALQDLLEPLRKRSGGIISAATVGRSF